MHFQAVCTVLLKAPIAVAFDPAGEDAEAPEAVIGYVVTLGVKASSAREAEDYSRSEVLQRDGEDALEVSHIEDMDITQVKKRSWPRAVRRQDRPGRSSE